MRAILPSNSPSIFEVLNRLSALQKDAIVRPTNPPPGLAGFLFDIPEAERIRLQSQISRHFVEKNTPVSDNIALEPEEFTVRGLVGEIGTFIPPTDSVEDQPEPLPLNPDILPSFPPQALQTQAQIDATNQRINNSYQAAGSLYGFYNQQVTPKPNQTAQSRTFAYFYQLWLGRQIFTVETPYGTFTDMAILALEAEQGDETRFRSSFSVTFQRIRYVSTVTVNAGQLAGRAALQAADVTQNGVAAKTTLTPEEKQSIFAALFPNFLKPAPAP